MSDILDLVHGAIMGDIEVKNGNVSYQNCTFNGKTRIFIDEKGYALFSGCYFVQDTQIFPGVESVSKIIKDKVKKIKQLAEKDFTNEQIASILELVENW